MHTTANQSLVYVCAQSVPGRLNFSRPKLSAFYVEIGLKKSMEPILRNGQNLGENGQKMTKLAQKSKIQAKF